MECGDDVMMFWTVMFQGKISVGQSSGCKQGIVDHNGPMENDLVSGYHLQILQILWNRGDLLLRRKYDRCTCWKRDLRREGILRAGK